MDSFDIVRGIRYWRIGKCFGRYSAFTANEAAIIWQHKTVSVQSDQAFIDEWVPFEEPEVNLHSRKYTGSHSFLVNWKNLQLEP